MARSRARSFVGAALAAAFSYAVVSALLPARTGPVDALAPGPAPESGAAAREVVMQPAPRGGPAPQSLPPTREPARVESPEPAQPSTAADPIGVVISGVVTDAAGTPLDEAFVWVQTPTGGRLNARTDARGRYTLGALPTGPWHVTAGKMDHHQESAVLELVATEPLVRQDFALRPEQVVWVRLVTASGAPTLPALREAELSYFGMELVPVATRDDPGATFTGVTGSLNNTFGIGTFWQAGNVRPDRGPEFYGTVSLHEDGPAWLSLVVAHQVLRKQRIEPSTTEVTFVVDPGDLAALQCGVRATLVDAESGEPLEGQVWLGGDPFPNGRGQAVGADGAVELVNQWPGERWLVVRVEGRARCVRELTLVAGQTHELGDVLLYAPVALRGHTRDAAGAPVEAVIRWGRLEPGDPRVHWAERTRTQSAPDGSFEIRNLEPGVYVIHSPGLPARSPRPADPSMTSLPLRVDATRGTIEGLELVLLASSAVTLATEDTSEPWPRVYALDAAGLPAASAWLGRYGRETPLSLPPGSYELVVERDGVELERRALTVTGDPQRIELEL